MYLPLMSSILQEFLDFIGTVKDRTAYHIGSPIQLDFMPGDVDVPDAMTPYEQAVPTCGGSLLRCSCGDCPDAPACAPSDTGGDATGVGRCTIIHIFGFPVWCTDGIIACAGLIVLGILAWLSSQGRLEPKTGSQPVGVCQHGGPDQSGMSAVLLLDAPAQGLLSTRVCSCSVAVGGILARSKDSRT